MRFTPQFERQVSEYIAATLASQLDRLVFGRFFRGTVTAVNVPAAGGTYTVRVRRTEQAAGDDGNTYAVLAGYLPQVGDMVEMVWRDDVTALCLGPFTTTASGFTAAGPPASPWKMRAHQSLAQPLAPATWTKLTLDTVGFDPDADFSTATSTYTVRVAGTYHLVGKHVSSAASGRVGCRLNRNAGTILVANHVPAHPNRGVGATVEDIQQLAKGDTLTLEGWQDLGANTVPGTTATFLAAHLLSAT